MLARLRREAPAVYLTCGIKELTLTVMDQIVAFVFAQEGKTVSDPVDRWGATLVRARCSPGATPRRRCPHLLAWAADQDWFATTGDERETARLAAVAAEARSVVAAYPDFGGAAADPERVPTDDRKHEHDAVTGRPGPAHPATGTAAPDLDTTGDTPATTPEEAAPSREPIRRRSADSWRRPLRRPGRPRRTWPGAVADGRPPRKRTGPADRSGHRLRQRRRGVPRGGDGGSTTSPGGRDARRTRAPGRT
ncbi:hypothetical protein LT493_02155 [Streptomyces tricolor]|nr:hypothetical protein [Streptomyces tricolor]